jgi:hypothetical protein
MSFSKATVYDEQPFAAVAYDDQAALEAVGELFRRKAFSHIEKGGKAASLPDNLH